MNYYSLLGIILGIIFVGAWIIIGVFYGVLYGYVYLKEKKGGENNALRSLLLSRV